MVNAAVAGAYGALLLALLVALANRGAAAGSGAFLLTVATVGPVYTVAAALLWSLLYAALRYFASHRLRLGWFSLRYVVALHAVNTGVVLAAGWSALSDHRRSLAPAAAARFGWALEALGAAWALAVVVSILPPLRRRLWAQAAAAALAVTALLAAAVGPPATAAAPRARAEGGSAARAAERRLVLINVDGADLDTVLTLQAQGKLPAFSRLGAEGAYGRLRSLSPCEAAVTRATLVTGRLPYRHGVRSGLSRRFFARGPWIDVVPAGIGFDLLLSPFLETRPSLVSDRGTRALWEMTGGAARVAGWDDDLDRKVPPGPVPGAAAPDGGVLESLLDPEALRGAEAGAPWLIAPLQEAAQADAILAEGLERDLRDRRPGVTAVSFPGLDRVGHLFLRYARPGEFGDVTATELELYGTVLERYYRRIDGLLGRALEVAGDDALLVVTSSHGMDPMPLRRRMTGALTGDAARSGTHRDAPDGFLFVRAPGAERGRYFGKGSLVDVVPTALYALNLPVARDLDGAVLAGVFSPAYIIDHPVAVIGTYETAP